MSRGLWIALAVAVFLAMLLPLTWFRGQESAIDWQRDYSTALAAAASRNQLVVAYLYTDWCRYCKQMDAETFSSERVAGEASRYTWLRLNAENDPEGIRLRKQFGVTGFPTILIFDGEGTKVNQIEGFLPAERFLQVLGSVAGSRDALEDLKKQAETQKPDAQYALAEKYLELGNYQKAAEAFSRVIQADPDNRAGKTALSHFYLALSLASLSQHQKALEELDMLGQRFPEGEFKPEATILRGQIYFHEGRMAQSQATLSEFLVNYPQHAKAELVKRMLREVSEAMPLRSSH